MTQSRPPFLSSTSMCGFVDEEPDKRKNDWKLNDRWRLGFIDNQQSLKLTTKARALHLRPYAKIWVQRQVTPTLKMLKN